ncbi:hypothetical protein [Persephonella sp. KM09-Lau-8]|uniref:hypothetical protein n=1 Tax=Persephonella sp. KM09-Lau-8 TaxID=1158345 RepID=UPI0004968186|nr:hypothetical protein [Persephonella sp. KM09-Lau-8]
MFQRFFGIFLLSISVVFAKDLGVFGSVYEIKEKDLLLEIKQKASSIDYEKIRKEYENKIKNYRPPDIVVLEKAEKSKVYYHIPWAEVPEDVYGVKNGKLVLLYKKGDKFNPLKYLPFKPIDLVIFNGDDKGEIAFVKKYFKNERVAFLITEGSFYKVSKELGVPVYYFEGKNLKDRLGVKETVSRITVDGEKLKITVFAVDEKGDLKEKKYAIKNGFLFLKVRRDEKAK